MRLSKIVTYWGPSGNVLEPFRAPIQLLACVREDGIVIDSEPEVGGYIFEGPSNRLDPLTHVPVIKIGEVHKITNLRALAEQFIAIAAPKETADAG